MSYTEGKDKKVFLLQVKFNDGSTSVVSEEDVYSSIEKLPKKVKSKLVCLYNAELCCCNNNQNLHSIKAKTM